MPTLTALSQPAQNNPKKIAIIGLGCGTTLDATLSTLPADWRIDLIEINPQMVQAHEHFKKFLTHNINDPRVNLITDEGFRFFRDAAKNPGQYDAVIIDVALGEGLSVAHLLTREMFANIHASLTDKGVIALWTAERQPFSPVSLSLFSTIYAAGFPSVYVGADRRVLLFGQKNEYNLRDHLTDFSIKITDIARDLSWNAPVNRLDSLIVNRMPYDHQAFINWRPWHWGQETPQDKDGL